MADVVEQPDVTQFICDWLLEIAPGTSLEDIVIEAHEQAPHTEPPCVLLEDAGHLRHPEVPAYLPFRLSVTTFGRTEAEASALYRSVTNHLHGAARVLRDGVGFWVASDETGPQPRRDPDSLWPARFGITDVFMPDRALASLAS